MNDEIQNIISGKSQVRFGANIRAAIHYLRQSQKTSALDKTDKRLKSEETERLKNENIKKNHCYSNYCDTYF
jgi:hypothetical protein